MNPVTSTNSTPVERRQETAFSRIGWRRVAVVSAALGWSVVSSTHGYAAATSLGLAVASDALIPHRLPGWSARSFPFLAASAAVAPVPTGVVTIGLAIFRHSRPKDGRAGSFGTAARWAVLEKVALTIGTLLAVQVTDIGAIGAALTYLLTGISMLLVVSLWKSSHGRFDPFESRLAAADFGRGLPLRLGIALVAGGLLASGQALALLALFPVSLLLAGLYERDLTRTAYRRGMLRGLGGMLRYSHPYTLAHMERVERVADRVGLELHMGSRHRARLAEAALLHDIGKVAVDERILEKPTSLTDAEFDLVKLHPEYGAQIVGAAIPDDPIVQWIRHHHERLDGSGYPQGLAGEAIPLESRIIAVIDAFDAMTGRADDLHRRAYRDPLPSYEARLELRRCSGSQFDSDVVAAFERVLLADDVHGDEPL